eukprot:m.226544 g.226544  ORF g.226544 m.226544 type:complete len:499 (-) comp11438_c0_seq1:35-1531(-)
MATTLLRAASVGFGLSDPHREDTIDAVSDDIDHLLQTVGNEAERAALTKNLEQFQILFAQYLQESGSKINWAKISPPREGMIREHSTLPHVEDADAISGLLSKLVVLKLNGGLGTSMGCVGPKSSINVRDDKTFLDLCVRQCEYLNETYNVDVPLVLMNSFSTHKDTQKLLRKYNKARCKILQFNQSRFPRIVKGTLRPLPTDNKDDSQWYPPGHGDFYQSLQNSGLLDQLLAEGKEWIFISNIDNLGATVDLDILSHVVANGESCEFVMEVTNKTRADVKGGTLIDYDGQTRLLEVAQVPKDKLEEFKSVSKFRIFNTNNLWIRVSAVKRILDARAMHMEVIENSKSLDNGQKIIQLETAVGSAIKNFKGGIGINVSRSRFLPVKKTSDLLLVMSNMYLLQHGTLRMAPQRQFDAPIVKLGDHHFAKVKEFLQRFENIPNIMELDHLTVSGDVVFGKDVTLKGTVIIIANEGEHIDIPAGAVLENKIVSGNLRILDH